MKKESKKGVVLVYVILIFAVLTILGAGLLAITNHNTKMTTMEINSEQAYQSALSGLETTLSSFEEDPTNGALVAGMVRAGQTPTTRLDLTSQKMGVVDIKISCKLEEAETDISACKKLQVDSTATINGLSRSVVGYLTIIEGGLEFPVNVDQYEDGIGYLKLGSSLYCQFGTQEAVSSDCEKGASASFKDDNKYMKYEKTPNEQKYKTKINELKLQAEDSRCPTTNGVIDKNCYYTKDHLDRLSLEIDNTKSDIIIDMTSVVNVNDSKFTLKDSNSKYSVIILTKHITFNDSSLGTSLKDADNFLLLATEKCKQEFTADKAQMDTYTWIVNPYGAKSSDLAVIVGASQKVTTIYGGIYSANLFQNTFTNIYGVQPSDSLLALFTELGLEMGGGGGSMTFAKTYD